jgi:hypothetical protein
MRIWSGGISPTNTTTMEASYEFRRTQITHKTKLTPSGEHSNRRFTSTVKYRLRPRMRFRWPISRLME